MEHEQSQQKIKASVITLATKNIHTAPYFL